jgi:lysophospholipase L1-like esterase
MKVRFAAIVALAVLATTLATTACGGGSGSRTIPTPTGPTTPIPDPDPEPEPEPEPTPKPTLGNVTRIMAFGDSLTEGESQGQLLVPSSAKYPQPGIPTSYPYKLQEILDREHGAGKITVYNLGKGGERARGSAKDRLEAALAEYKPQVVIIMHGVNDLIASVADHAPSITNAVDGVEELVEISRQGNRGVFLASLPREEDTSKAKGFELVDPFNVVLEDIAREEGATFVDIHAVITNAMLMPDGLHITPAGNQKMADTFYAAIKKKYHKAPPAAR